MKKHVKVTINRLGIPRFEGIGFHGDECITKMKPLEDAFGGRQLREDKPEMQEIAPEQQEGQNLSL